MKKKLLLTLLVVMALTCLFAISVSALTPNNEGETFVSSDGTTLALYDTEGNALAWFYDSAKSEYVPYRVGIDFTMALGSDRELLPTTVISDTDGDDSTTFPFTVANMILLNGRDYSAFTYISGTWASMPLEAIYVNNTFRWINKTSFNNNNTLKVFNIPKDHTGSLHIGPAFVRANALESFYIPKGATFESTSTFEYSTGLKSVEFHKEWEGALKGYEFNGCTALKSVILAGTITSIPANTFSGCSSLTDVEIPSGVTTIGSQAFYNCSSLESINLPSGLTKLDGVYYNAGAFANCSSLKSITIPSSVTVMQGKTFQNCTALETVTFEPRNGVDITFGNATFEKCTSLKELIIPEGITTLTECFASECTGLQKIVLPTTLTTLTGTKHFYHAGNSSATGSIEILGIENTQITAFSTDCFRQNRNWKLDELRLPNTCTTINDYAFADASIGTFYVGANVTTIGNGALGYNSALKVMYLPSTVTSINAYAFYNNNGSALYIIVGVDDPSSTVIDTIETAVQSGKDESAYIKYADYVANPSSYSGKNIVYGGNKCAIFYNNVHTTTAIEGNTCQGLCSRCLAIVELENPQHANVWVFTGENGESASLLAVIIATETCENCGKESTVHEIDAIFKSTGYSYEEDESGNYTGIYQKTSVNKNALALYAELTGNKDAYNYGIVGGLAADKDGNEIAGNIIESANGVVAPANGTTVVGTFLDTDYTIIQIKITGITNESSVYCGAFIATGNNVTYLCGTTQGNVATKATFPTK